MPSRNGAHAFPRKRHRIAEKTSEDLPVTKPGLSSDGPSDSEDAVFDESFSFDHLLSAIRPCKKSSSGANIRREKESKNHSKEEESEGSESSSVSDKMNSDEDSDNDATTSSSDADEIEAAEHGPSEFSEQTKETKEDDAEISDSDEDNNLEDNERGLSTYARSKSNFHAHLLRTLTEAEVGDLTKRFWKYVWEMPSFESSTSKWKGTGECLPEEKDALYGLKVKLYKHWMESFEKPGGVAFDSSRERHFFALCNSYRDILHPNKKGFYLKGSDEDPQTMDAYIMHAVNHVWRSRTLITKNDARLARNPYHNETELLHGGDFLDRGFTRPKVLFLLPFRSIAFRVVKRLIKLTPPSNKTNVEYFDRFRKEFGADNGDGEDMAEGLNGAHTESQKSNKPLDFQALFGGNISEEFMIGIKLTKKSIKLYNDFYSSDIIVASPVQLIQAIGKAEAEKEKDVDYLSSIEVLIVDHADILAMQNWSHVSTILDQLNKIPYDTHGADIMRIRPWYLNGHAQFYRQTIILGSFLNPDINASFSRCVNYEGKVKLIPDYKGVLSKVLLPIKQVFERFDASISDAADARFDYFVTKVFPKIKDSFQGGIMVFISCYFDFVRIRNFLRSQNASFCLLGEYTKQSDISRARGWFFKGERKIMLYTERAHFYHRYKIRGVQNIIFYSLPERKEFYPEIINMLGGANKMSCSILFSRFDNLQLERIVSSAASKRMLSSDKRIFAFC